MGVIKSLTPDITSAPDCPGAVGKLPAPHLAAGDRDGQESAAVRPISVRPPVWGLGAYQGGGGGQVEGGPALAGFCGTALSTAAPI